MTVHATDAKPAPEADQLLDGLNPQQRLAVVHEGSPLLIVAGALTHSGAGIIPTVLAAACASVMADAGWYIAGKRWGRKVLATYSLVTLHMIGAIH